MKKLIIFTLLLAFISTQTHLNAQNKTYSWRYHHKILKTYLDKHETIAIIPMEVTITDRKLSKNKNSSPEVIAQKEKQFQTDFQRAFYERLAWMKEKNKLKNIEVQDIEVTNKLLAENGINDIEDLVELKYSQIAEMLGVDAIFCGEAEITQHMSKVGAMVFESMTNTRAAADRSNITLKLYDGQQGELIWRVIQGFDNNSMIWKTEKLIQKMFKERLSKDFPYHKRF